MLRRSWPLLLVLCVAGAGCNTAFGNYFANRARDLGECFRVQVGGGLGIGASASALGLADTCAGVAAVPRSLGVGWVYGEPYAFGAGATGTTWDCEVGYSILPVGQAAAVVGAALYSVTEAPRDDADPNAPPVYAAVSLELDAIESPGGWTRPGGTHWRVDGAPDWHGIERERADHWCYGFFPGALAHVRTGDDHHDYLWSDRAVANARRAHVHAFDVEAAVYAGVIHVRVGVSPGQLVDFLLGWFGVDLAGDDRGLPD